MAEDHDTPEYLSTKEAATVARVGRRAVQKWVRQGVLLVVQRVPKLLIARADLDEFLHSRQEPVQAVPTRPKGQSFTLSDAARLCGVSRTTLQRAVRAGRLRLNADHRIEKGELIHAGYFQADTTTDSVAASGEQADETADRLSQLSAQMADLLVQHQSLGAKLGFFARSLQKVHSRLTPPPMPVEPGAELIPVRSSAY